MTKRIIQSWLSFIRLVLSGSLHLHRKRLGEVFHVHEGNYTIFRETVNEKTDNKKSVVLVVGFRLKFIRSNPACHWLFQRCCILTTPFWSGFPGFRIKLWMVDTQTKNYLGIYEWEGKEHASVYVKTLETILRPLSVKGSVWYELHETINFQQYLQEHQI